MKVILLLILGLLVLLQWQKEFIFNVVFLLNIILDIGSFCCYIQFMLQLLCLFLVFVVLIMLAWELGVLGSFSIMDTIVFCSYYVSFFLFFICEPDLLSPFFWRLSLLFWVLIFLANLLLLSYLKELIFLYVDIVLFWSVE